MDNSIVEIRWGERFVRICDKPLYVAYDERGDILDGTYQITDASGNMVESGRTKTKEMNNAAKETANG